MVYGVLIDYVVVVGVDVLGIRFRCECVWYGFCVGMIIWFLWVVLEVCLILFYAFVRVGVELWLFVICVGGLVWNLIKFMDNNVLCRMMVSLYYVVVCCV